MSKPPCPECLKDCEECSSPGVWEDMHAELAKLREENSAHATTLKEMEVYVIGELPVYPHTLAGWVKQMGGTTWEGKS